MGILLALVCVDRLGGGGVVALSTGQAAVLGIDEGIVVWIAFEIISRVFARVVRPAIAAV